MEPNHVYIKLTFTIKFTKKVMFMSHAFRLKLLSIWLIKKNMYGKLEYETHFRSRIYFQSSCFCEGIDKSFLVILNLRHRRCEWNWYGKAWGRVYRDEGTVSNAFYCCQSSKYIYVLFILSSLCSIYQLQSCPLRLWFFLSPPSITTAGWSCFFEHI